MFVGEAPGPEEDCTGEPFTGRSGHLLDRIIEAMGHLRDDVFLTNVVLCRLDDDQFLERTQVEACRDHLESQIQAVDPRIIVPLGATAWQWFDVGDRRPMSEVRGHAYRWRTRTLAPTYHPAFLLRKPRFKRDV